MGKAVIEEENIEQTEEDLEFVKETPSEEEVMKEKFIDAMTDIHDEIGFSITEMEIVLFSHKTQEGDKVKYILKGVIEKP